MRTTRIGNGEFHSRYYSVAFDTVFPMLPTLHRIDYLACLRLNERIFSPNDRNKCKRYKIDGSYRR